MLFPGVTGNKKLSHALVTQDLSQAPQLPPASSGDGNFRPWEMRTCVSKGRGIDDRVVSIGWVEAACALHGCLVLPQQIPQVLSCTRGGRAPSAIGFPLPLNENSTPDEGGVSYGWRCLLSLIFPVCEPSQGRVDEKEGPVRRWGSPRLCPDLRELWLLEEV